MKSLVIKSGQSDFISSGQGMLGNDVTRHIKDVLTELGIVTKTNEQGQCCFSYTGGGVGGPTTVTTSFNSGTNVVTIDVNGVVSTFTVLTDTGDVTTTTALTIGGTVYPIGTSLTTILSALATGTNITGSFTPTATNATLAVNSSTGTDASIVIPSGTASVAGLISAAKTTEYDSKQVALQVQDDAVNTGTVNPTVLNFATGVTATQTGSVVTINATGTAASAMVGSTTAAAGVSGLVPTPPVNSQNQYLTGSGTFLPSIPGFSPLVNYEVGDVVYDPATEKIYRFTTAQVAGPLNLTNMVELSPSGGTIIEYQSGTSRILATGTGVTVTKSIGLVTTTIPANVVLLGVHHDVTASDVEPAADAAGVTNRIVFRFVNTFGNTSSTDMRVPQTQFISKASGLPATTNAYQIDLDNNPTKFITAVGGNSIDIRYAGLAIANGAIVSFTNI